MEASVRRPRRVEDLRTEAPSKLADSKSRLSVSSSISESRPPIMPAMATGISSPPDLVHIIKVFSSTFRSVPSRVVKVNGESKRLTLMLSTLAQSKACMGWPISSIR